MRKVKPPHPAGLFLLVAMAILSYYPLRNSLIPVLEEQWFWQVTRRLVDDATTLTPPEGSMWLGATRPELPQSLWGVYELENQIKTPMSIVSFYQAWGDGDSHEFPSIAMQNMHQAGFLPMITWEPWLSAFKQNHGAEPHASLQQIINGKYDTYIKKWARAAVRHGKPFLLRIAHESTNPQYSWAQEYGNSANDYKAFWQHVKSIFIEEGAKNVLFAWTPYTLTEQDYYPGDTLVDWIGFDIFNYGAMSIQGSWIDFYSITKLYIDQYSSFKKPMFIAEVATTSAGGNKSDWVRDMLRSICNQEIKGIQAIIWFDVMAGSTASGLPINWSLSEIENVKQLFTEEKCPIFQRYHHE